MVTKQYLKMVKMFALYHFIAVLPFTLPFISEHVLNLLGKLHILFNLAGSWLVPSPTYMMFVNLFASIALLWALYRFLYPSLLLGKFEGFGMLFLSFIVLFYVVNGASLIWLLIPIIDIPGGFVHLYFTKLQDE